MGDWATIAAPRIACGMIGSRQGWIEAPYLDCPAGLATLARSLATAPDGVRSRSFPASAAVDAAGVPDVMRGEETQIVGALADGSGRDARRAARHAQQMGGRRAAGASSAFATFMTGEVFAVLKDHSILGRMMAAGGDAGEPGDGDFGAA